MEKFKLMKYIKLQHEVTDARWDQANGKWHLTIRRPKAGSVPTSSGEVEFEEFQDTADFVLAGTGALSRWKWPEIEGLESFRKKGLVVHSAQWEWEGMSKDDRGLSGWQETVKGWAGKRVGVIGVVSSQSQIKSVSSSLK